MKRWIAGLLAAILLLTGCVTAAEEEYAADSAVLPESTASAEGTASGELAEDLQLLQVLMEDEDFRNLFRIEDVRDVATEIVWKVLVWMAENRPVTMKILTEFGVGEEDRSCISTIWDSVDRVAAALQNYYASEDGERLIAEFQMLQNDPDILESIRNIWELIQSEDLASLMNAVVDAVEADLEGAKLEGPLTQQAIQERIDNKTYIGSLILRIMDVIEQCDWMQTSLPKLAENETLWMFLKHLADRNAAMNGIVESEMLTLSKDPAVVDFVQRNLQVLGSIILQARDLIFPDETAETNNKEENVETAKEEVSP